MSEIAKAVASPASIVAAVLVLLAVLALVIWMRRLEKKINSSLTRNHDVRQERDRAAREKGKRDELGQLKSELHNDIESLRSILGSIAADTQRLIANSQSRSLRETNAPPPHSLAVAYDAYEESRGAEDGLAQLLSIANRIVQQSSTTLDAFRASTGSFAAHVSAYPSATEGAPTAFVVEHRGAYYGIPNVVKPQRLPQDWFNRSDFGVNDEIRRVVSLPRLRPRGADYDVQEPGVFAR